MIVLRRLNLTPAIGVLLTACSGSADTELQAELLEMGRIDQEAVERAHVLVDGLPGSAEELIEAVDEQDKLFGENFRRLEAIVAEYGWPGRQLVGEQASGAALIVLQHADVQSQKRYLSLSRAAAAEGDVAGPQLARLEDGIRQGEGRDQIYGTRVVSDADGRPVLYPIENPQSLDARREAAGLPPIEEQLKEQEIQIGMPIGRGNLRP